MPSMNDSNGTNNTKYKSFASGVEPNQYLADAGCQQWSCGTSPPLPTKRPKLRRTTGFTTGVKSFSMELPADGVNDVLFFFDTL